MRVEPERLSFEIAARDGAARTGVLHTAHGPVRTPAFIPLATKGTVRGLESHEVAELGYEMVLGNTYHLFVSPGPERISRAGGLHGFMGWERALITDSGGFQVFSLAHGGVANEVKGSGRQGGRPRVGGLDRGGGGPLSLLPRRGRAVHLARGLDAGAGGAGVRHRPGLRRVHSLPRRSGLHGAVAERTHRWLDRCLEWHGEHGPARQAVFGIVQGGVHEDLRRESAEYISAAGVDGLAIGGTLGRDKAEMREVLGFTAPLLPEPAPKHLLGIGEVDDLLAGIALGLDVFDCAVPTRLARHGVALVPDPDNRFRLDLRKSGHQDSRDPIAAGCPCPACQNHDRDYVSYLSRAEELTAVRLLCLHNLTYLHQLMTHARAAIASGSFASYSAAAMNGEPPWAAIPSSS